MPKGNGLRVMGKGVGAGKGGRCGKAGGGPGQGKGRGAGTGKGARCGRTGSGSGWDKGGDPGTT